MDKNDDTKVLGKVNGMSLFIEKESKFKGIHETELILMEEL